MFIRIAAKSLLNRKGSFLLTVSAMVVSIFVLLSVEHIRHQTKANFANTVSGVDLIVGARTGQLNLLLYSVFRIGAASNNISWQAHNTIANNQQVKWTVPISLGDSHRGFRVVATTKDYFTFFSYGSGHKLQFEKGRVFNNVFDVVLGANVAKSLGYSLGDTLVLAHGIGQTSFHQHAGHPFTVVGILASTGTPVDQSVHVGLQGVEAIHHPEIYKVEYKANPIINKDFEASSVTAILVGLNSKLATFSIQRMINNHKHEALMAILPGITLTELWQSMSLLENVLRLISALIFLSSALGLSAMLLTSIRERYQEIKLLRIIGASPRFIFCFIQLEALLITTLSTTVAIAFLQLVLLSGKGYFINHFGLSISTNLLTQPNLFMLLGLIVCAQLLASIPSLKAFRFAKNIE